jgi:predicted phage gp36 major capsid-like protein
MSRESLEEPMNGLERRVKILEQLPERVTALESQIVQLRDEMRSEFSATRAEARAGDEETRRTLREEIRAGDEETRRVLTTRMDDLFGANERHMRLLHEDLVQRIATLKENRQ